VATTNSKIKMVSESIPVRYLRPSFMVAWPVTRSGFHLHVFGNAFRAIRIGSFFGHLFPNFPFCL
jgi:hypothetical protein